MALLKQPFKYNYLDTASRFVSWPELVPIFRGLYPRAIHDAWNNNEIVIVRYAGVDFEIRPYFTALSKPDEFRVFGPPHINPFPDNDSARRFGD